MDILDYIYKMDNFFAANSILSTIVLKIVYDGNFKIFFIPT